MTGSHLFGELGLIYIMIIKIIWHPRQYKYIQWKYLEITCNVLKYFSYLFSFSYCIRMDGNSHILLPLVLCWQPSRLVAIIKNTTQSQSTPQVRFVTIGVNVKRTIFPKEYRVSPIQLR